MSLHTESLPVAQIVDFLTNHPESLRVKKLIFYTAKNYWENDENMLSKLDLRSIIIDLKSSHSTIQELSDALLASVASLNRQDVYATIATTIIDQCKKLYQNVENSGDQTVGRPLNQSDINRAQLKLIAHKLESHEEAERIKKILFYVCQRRWENDIAVMKQYSLLHLIEQLKAQFLTFISLKKYLFGCIETLNRPSLYYGIAIDIIQEVQILYEADQKATFVGEVGLTTPLRQGTNQVTRLLLDDPVTPAIVEDDDLEEMEDEFKQKIKGYDLLEMRLYLTQYANPLRAKIVLFSLVYHIFAEKNEKDWSMLRTCTLEDLLLKVFDCYSTLAEVQEKLDEVKSHLTHKEAVAQTGLVIIQALTSFYESVTN